MKQLSLRSLAASAVLFALSCAPSMGQQANALANYVVNIGGINVAYVDIRLESDGAGYQLDLSADVAGLAELVAQGSGAVNSGGRVTPEGLAAERFYLETRTSSARFSLQTSFNDGSASEGTVSPPLEPNAARVPVSGSDRSGVNDPVASFILRGGALGPSLCDRTMRIYTGIERFDLALTYVDMDEATSNRTGYQGPVVLCAMQYVPISGHFETSEITNYLRDTQRMLVWFAPLGRTGYFIPYRVIIGTNRGDLSMVLTSVQ